MMKRSLNFYIRKSHRYLGLFIGLQFLLWTAGGFYFSWMNIKEIRGENLVSSGEQAISLTDNLVSPVEGLKQIEERFRNLEISKIQLTEVLETPYYEVTTLAGEENLRIFLVDAQIGKLRESILKEEAVQIARNALNQESELAGIDYLASGSVGPHHEYRGKPLPAWAVKFRTPKEFTVYVSAESGRIEAVRTQNWRIFDFLWMLHTMDYNGRDDINNYVLRAFSILGLTTIISGFLLFGISSPYLRRRIRSWRR